MRILVVEDEHKVAGFIKKGLEAERYAVDVASDGQSGLDLALVYDYDLLILDLMLPGLIGSEVLATVRRQKPNLPILILTARDALQDKVKHFEQGCDDYLTKPFAFAELVMRVKALLRRGAVDRRNQLQVADLVLDRVSRKVTRAGKPIDLTVKEFALLEYLMTNASQVCSRAMIIEHVWDQSFDSFTNIVDVYIRYVRNKIDRDFEPKLIHTVRGVGYVLRGEAER
ncbi:MAG: response regulator transcription factor [Acidobacteria bacterium]|nr:response regulator transcription factor [Acidobacteriota bacterium]